MDGTIRELRARYVVAGDRAEAGPARTRLDGLARRHMGDALGPALDQAFPDDDAVYLVRRIDAQVTLHVSDLTSDARAARRWAGGVAGAVARQVRDGAEGVLRFPDRATYLARFVADLVEGGAWDRWYWAHLTALRSLGVQGAARSVLLQHRDDLPSVLAHLHSCGDLEHVLQAVGEKTSQRLWSEGLGGHQLTAAATPGSSGAGEADLRPIYAGARRLVAELGLAPADGLTAEAGFARYLAAGGTQPDWRDRGGLSDAVTNAVCFLVGGDALRSVDIARLRRAIATFEWLDRERLLGSLTDTGAQEIRPSPTPRQRELLRDLEAVATGAKLDRGRPAAAANALRLYATMVARDSRWAGDSLAVAAIESLLVAWAAGAAEPFDPKPQGAGVFVAAAAGLAVKLPVGAAAPQAAPDRIVDSACAGVYLLVRALIDARLPRQATLDPAADLTALALRWAGEAGLHGERIDAGIQLLAGDAGPETLAELAERWSDRPPEWDGEFQTGLLRTLVGLGLAIGPELRLHRVDTSTGPGLVAGTGSVPWWPLGRDLEPAGSAPGIVREWLVDWESATGAAPAELTCDAPLFDELSGAGVEVRVPGGEAPNDARPERALEALEAGRLGLPSHDLTLGLASAALLRAWARWLRGFTSASVPYLLEAFVRRPGRIAVEDGELVVKLAPLPLDVVLETSGYWAPLEHVPFLDRAVRFERRTPE